MMQIISQSIEENEFDLEEELEDEFLDFDTLDSRHQDTSQDIASNSDLTIEIVDSDGEVKTVRRSTFLWMLSESNEKLSSDRLKRVRGTDSNLDSNSTRKKSKSINVFSDGSNILKLNELKIGDWALFCLDGIIPIGFEANDLNGHFIANIIGFRFIDENNRPTQYKMGHVLIDKIKENLQKNVKKSIEVLAIWYICQPNKILKQYNGKLTVEIEKYMGTIKQPLPEAGPTSDLNIINNVLQFEYCELESFIRDTRE